MMQVGSVILVTAGVILATLAASGDKSSASAGGSSSQYAIGISMLLISLIVSGFMGLWQEETFRRYGASHWQEALFYSHFLSLPLFAIRAPQLMAELSEANATPKVEMLKTLVRAGKGVAGGAGRPSIGSQLLGLLGLRTDDLYSRLADAQVPSFYLLLGLYVLTQLVCITGVNRLTTRVSSVGVTLTLSVRKAVSLAISIYIAGGAGQKGGARLGLLWIGAVAVLVGTVGYARGSSSSSKSKSPSAGGQKENGARQGAPSEGKTTSTVSKASTPARRRKQ